MAQINGSNDSVKEEEMKPNIKKRFTEVAKLAGREAFFVAKDCTVEDYIFGLDIIIRELNGTRNLQKWTVGSKQGRDK